MADCLLIMQTVKFITLVKIFVVPGTFIFYLLFLPK